MDRLPFPPGPLLAAVDFSQGALAALEGASRLARRWGCPLRAVHVLEEAPAASWQGGEDSGEPLRRRAEALERLRAAAGGLGCSRLEVREGDDAASEILALARKSGAGLLALGSRGLSPWQGRILGSVSAAVVRAAGVPVLVFHGPLAPAWPQRVLVGAKFTEAGDRGLLFAARLAASVGGVVGALHVRDEAEPPEATRTLEEHLGRLLAAEGFEPPSFSVVAGRPAAALAQAAERGLYDLLVVCDSRRPFGLGAGTAQRLIGLCAAPLLVLPSETAVRVGV